MQMRTCLRTNSKRWEDLPTGQTAVHRHTGGDTDSDTLLDHPDPHQNTVENKHKLSEDYLDSDNMDHLDRSDMDHLDRSDKDHLDRSDMDHLDRSDMDHL